MKNKYSLIFVALCSIWAILAWFMTHKNNMLQNSYQKKSNLLRSYHHLEALYGSSSQKRIAKQFHQLLIRHGITPSIQKSAQKSQWHFRLTDQNANAIINFLIKNPLILQTITILKVNDNHLDVSIEVAE